MSKKVRINEREDTFVNLILSGMELLEAYREVYHNGYNDSKARHAAKAILKKEHVAEYMQSLILDRSEGLKIDEAFVIDNLKKVVMERAGTTQAVQALKLLGQYMAMWVDKQVIEDNSSHADIAREMFERRQAIERGEEVKPFEEIEEHGAEIIEFELHDDKNGTD